MSLPRPTPPQEPQPEDRRAQVAERTRHLRSLGVAGAVATLGVFAGLAAVTHTGSGSAQPAATSVAPTRRRDPAATICSDSVRPVRLRPAQPGRLLRLAGRRFRRDRAGCLRLTTERDVGRLVIGARDVHPRGPVPRDGDRGRGADGRARARRRGGPRARLFALREEALSRFLPTSELSRLNRSAGTGDGGEPADARDRRRGDSRRGGDGRGVRPDARPPDGGDRLTTARSGCRGG